MAQSSAQREPSMEEILASIRRIIEDSDTGRKPDDGAAEPDEPADEFSVLDVAAFRSELRSGANDPLPSSATPPEPWPSRPVVAERAAAAAVPAVNGSRPFSMADIQADLAMTLEDSRAASPVSAGPEPKPAATYADAPAQPAVAAPMTVTVAAPYEPLPRPVAANRSDHDEDAELDEAISAALDKATQSSDAREQSDWDEAWPAEDSGLARLDSPASSRGPIISQQTGRQVAAAFGELSEAFAASRRKSFDELAEEMMRPMLQDWLDNNLPTLVEKLVREEIERIARGAQ